MPERNMVLKIKQTLLTLALSLLLVTSCADTKETEIKTPPPSENTPVVEQETENEIPEEQVNAIPESEFVQEPENEPEEIKYINPLTGLQSQKDLTNVRPIAVMINNLKQALPQIGISEADIIYETLEEGGITRLLCVYNDYSDIPEIGSVRSARDYYIDIADAHDAIFVHAGGSTYAYSALSERNTANVDGIYHSEFYRSAERRKTMSKEHTLMISGEGIDHAIAYRGYRKTSDNPCPLVFSQDFAKGDTVANHIEIPFSIGYTSRPYSKAFFDFNSETGKYLKGEYNEPHIDGDDGTQLSFKNVITLTCPMNVIKGDPLGCIQVHFTGTGKGTYSVDGTQREIVWKKSSRSSSYTLCEADGETPLVLSPGKTYIAIVPTGTKISVE